MKAFALLSAAACATAAATTEHDAGALAEIMARAALDPEGFAAELAQSEFAAFVPELEFPSGVKSARAQTYAPVAVTHGMGDSCFNRGMKNIAKEIGEFTDSYSVCVPSADSWLRDTLSGFLMNMDANVEAFAAAVQADENLASGFNAVGFSQGNSIIRGYIQKYNDPPVLSFLSVHGTVSGVTSLPNCDPAGSRGSLCQTLTNALANIAYTSFGQNVLFQADYLRDPTFVAGDAYLSTSQIGAWNNENPATVDPAFAANFGKTSRFAMVKAAGDTMVFPNDGEWWGGYVDGAYDTIVPMNQTSWYTSDGFGLKTADEAGKIFYESTAGDHLQFTSTQLLGWVEDYFL